MDKGKLPPNPPRAWPWSLFLGVSTLYQSTPFPASFLLLRGNNSFQVEAFFKEERKQSQFFLLTNATFYLKQENFSLKIFSRLLFICSLSIKSFKVKLVRKVFLNLQRWCQLINTESGKTSLFRFFLFFYGTKQMMEDMNMLTRLA